MTRSFLLALPALAACSDVDYQLNSQAPEAGEVDSESPVAVCNVSPSVVTPPFQAATFDGSASYDPKGGEIVEYTWSIVEAPAGSAATLGPAGGSKVTGFLPDLAGDYVVELIVTNDLGQDSAPCETTLQSIPGQDLWVEMYWEHAGDDMDLHLLAPGGVRETDTDCYYSNCTNGGLDWGERGYHGDDPSLDLDDINGTGPENINISEPDSGNYTVIVHDYPSSTFQEPNAVTVNVYLGGEQVLSTEFDMEGENTYEGVATINWDNGTVHGM